MSDFRTAWIVFWVMMACGSAIISGCLILGVRIGGQQAETEIAALRSEIEDLRGSLQYCADVAEAAIPVVLEHDAELAGALRLLLGEPDNLAPVVNGGYRETAPR